MDGNEPSTRFEPIVDLDGAEPTLIEGLPGVGLVATIAADQITRQLDLEHYGNIHSEAFPPVTSFEDGRVQAPVRVHAGEDPPVMTLLSGIPVPPESYKALSTVVLEDLAPRFERAVFLVGAPAQDEEELGEFAGIATTDPIEQALEDAGIPLAEGSGAIGGITGALMRECYHADVPAAALMVKAHPQLPDPGAARTVIENALEPLVEFDIDTEELKERAEEVQEKKQRIAQQLQQAQGIQQQASEPATDGSPPTSPTPSPYQ